MAEVTIYKITNTINGKVYIGSSITPELRKQTHLNALKKCTHYNKELQNDYTKQDGTGFNYSILGVCSEVDRNKVELEFINKHNSFRSGYNVGIPSEVGSVSSTVQLKIIPFICDNRFSPLTNLVYSYLLEMYRIHSELGLPLYLRNGDISSATGFSPSTVKRATRELRKFNLVSTTVDKCFNINLYTVNNK